jgi:hypothetical protein
MELNKTKKNKNKQNEHTLLAFSFFPSFTAIANRADGGFSQAALLPALHPLVLVLD